MLTIGAEQITAIDSAAHVIETEQTWSYLQSSEEQFQITQGQRKAP